MTITDRMAAGAPAAPAPTATRSPTPGLRHALFLTRPHARFLRPGLGELTGQPPPVPAQLRAADRAYRDALDELARRAGLAA